MNVNLLLSLWLFCLFSLLLRIAKKMLLAQIKSNFSSGAESSSDNEEEDKEEKSSKKAKEDDDDNDDDDDNEEQGIIGVIKGPSCF